MTTLSHSPMTGIDPAFKLAPVKRPRVAAPIPGTAQRLAYTLDEAAASLGEKPEMIARLCRRKEFPNAYKGGLGGRTAPWRIPADDLTNFMKKRGTTR